MSDNVAGLPNRGKVYNVTSTTAAQSAKLEGYQKYFQDEDASGAGPSRPRSSRRALMRLVRNSSGIALLPKRAVAWESGQRGKRVDGYTTTTAAEVAGIVDDQLPAAGAADNALFWIHRQGPALCTNDIASGASTVISEGDLVVALTAATSLAATTAGRIATGTLTATSTATTDGSLTNRILHRLGKAMSARTTANTNSDVLVDLDLMP